MPDFLILLFYFLLCCFLISRVSFFKNANPGISWLLILFVIKVAAGFFYGWFYSQPQYRTYSDSWNFFELSKTETDWLLKDPAAFIKDLFSFGYEKSGDLFLGKDSYWNDLKTNIIIKLLAICNVITGKSYYAGMIIFNFLYFFGCVAFFRVFDELSTAGKILKIAIVFCIPSFLFWCSGLHKDGFIFLFFALIIYHVYKQLKAARFSIKSVTIIILSVIVLFGLRNFMVILLMPAVAIWVTAIKFPVWKWKAILAIYGTGIIFSFASVFISADKNVPAYIVNKQAEFKRLPGNSQISLPDLEPTLTGFIEFFPYAADIAFLRPHPDDIKNKSYIPAVAEIMALWLLVIFIFFKRNKNKPDSMQLAFALFCFCFCISYLLLAGYTVTFSGSIVRYRAIILPVLFAGVILISGFGNMRKQVNTR